MPQLVDFRYEPFTVEETQHDDEDEEEAEEE